MFSVVTDFGSLFFWLLQVCRLFWQDCCKMQCSHTHVSMYLSGLYIQSNSRQWGKRFFFFFFPKVVTYYPYLYTDMIGFETLRSKVLSIFLFNLEKKTFKKLLAISSAPHPGGSLALGCSFFKISSVFHVD